MASCGVREVIRFLAQHRMVDVIVSTAGGIEEDFVKCLAPTYVNPGGFRSDGASLRKQGLNRIGNLLVPNDNYCHFEDWVMPILDEMLREQKEVTRLMFLLYHRYPDGHQMDSFQGHS
jgi:deoxyhypusine synthase